MRVGVEGLGGEAEKRLMAVMILLYNIMDKYIHGSGGNKSQTC